MSDLPIKKNVARTFYLPGLPSQANTKIFQVNPTIAVGDFKYTGDGGALTNLATLPDVYPAGGTQVRFQVAQAELNNNQLNIIGIDAAGNEWCSVSLVIFTSSTQMGDIAAAVWDRLTSVLTTAGSIGKRISDNVDMVLSLIYSRLGAPVDASVSADIAAINAKTTNLPSDPADQSLLLAAINTRATPADVDVSVAVSASVARAVSNGDMAIEAGYTFEQEVTSTLTEDLSSATKLWLAFKQFRKSDDSQSLIFVEVTDGLTIVNGVPSYATPADASLTVSGSSGAWRIVFYIKYTATALLFGKNLDECFVGIKAKIGTKEIPVWESQNSSVIDGIVRAN